MDIPENVDQEDGGSSNGIELSFYVGMGGLHTILTEFGGSHMFNARR